MIQVRPGMTATLTREQGGALEGWVVVSVRQDGRVTLGRGDGEVLHIKHLSLGWAYFTGGTALYLASVSFHNPLPGWTDPRDGDVAFLTTADNEVQVWRVVSIDDTGTEVGVETYHDGGFYQKVLTCDEGEWAADGTGEIYRSVAFVRPTVREGVPTPVSYRQPQVGDRVIGLSAEGTWVVAKTMTFFGRQGIHIDRIDGLKGPQTWQDVDGERWHWKDELLTFVEWVQEREPKVGDYVYRVDNGKPSLWEVGRVTDGAVQCDRISPDPGTYAHRSITQRTDGRWCWDDETPAHIVDCNVTEMAWASTRLAEVHAVLTGLYANPDTPDETALQALRLLFLIETGLTSDQAPSRYYEFGQGMAERMKVTRDS